MEAKSAHDSPNFFCSRSHCFFSLSLLISSITPSSSTLVQESADPAANPRHAEAAVDAMRAQKDEELERYRREAERRTREQAQRAQVEEQSAEVREGREGRERRERSKEGGGEGRREGSRSARPRR